MVCMQSRAIGTGVVELMLHCQIARKKRDGWCSDMCRYSMEGTVNMPPVMVETMVLMSRVLIRSIEGVLYVSPVIVEAMMVMSVV